MLGGMLSFPLTVMINDVVLVIWFTVAEQFTVVSPTGNNEPDGGVHIADTELPSLVAFTAYPTFAPLDVIGDW